MSQKRITSFFTSKDTQMPTPEPKKLKLEDDKNIPRKKDTSDEKDDIKNEKIPVKEECNDEIPSDNDSASDCNEEKPKINDKKNFVLSGKTVGKTELKMDCSNQSSSSEQIGADYNPAKSNYHPVNDAFWSKGQRVPYLALARTFEIIEDTRGRIKMIEVLSNFFSSVIVLSPEDLLSCIYLSINQLSPTFEGLELCIAEGNLMKIICNTTGRTMKYIKAQVHDVGDLGIVAEQSRVAQRMITRPAVLTVRGIHEKLKQIAKISGGSTKTDLIQNIFVSCRYSEARYFVRSLIGKLRIGIAELSLINALAIAIVNTPPTEEYNDEVLNTSGKMNQASYKKKVDDTSLLLKTAFCQCPNYDKLIPTLLKHGVKELLSICTMEPGVPVKPMLAQPTKSVREVIDRFEGLEIACEWKYDGERAQIHCDENGVVQIYSRNQENNTSKYPDVISRIADFRKKEARSFIVDSEIVAWDVERKQILPFQILSTRKRKRVELEDIKVQVCVYAFDLLYINGKPLVNMKFSERRELLKENFGEVDGIWQFAKACDTTDMNEVQQFLDESVKGNCEGLMIKTLHVDSTYEIAKRSRSWLKLKKDYLAGVGDSLDLVVIGGYKGKGKRTGFYGGFLLACYDSENEEYQSICKIGTGFSDEDLLTHANFLKQHILKTPKSYYSFDSSIEPDEWFEPVQVWEIKCADLSLSPVHRAAIGIIDPERGISLRFPRFIRIRDDKSSENATSAQQVADMYSSQDQIKNQQGDKSNMDSLDEFY